MEKRVCKECGKEFVLTDGEVAFFNSKGLNLPKRCKKCRNKNNPRLNTYVLSTHTDKGSETKKKAYIFKFILPVALAIVIAIVSGSVLLQKIDDALFTTDDTSSYSTLQQNINTTEKFDTENAENEETKHEKSTLQQNNNTSENFDTEDAENEETKHEKSSDSRFTFRNNALREDHFKKHGESMGFKSAEEYEKAASMVISNVDSLHKREKEDNDFVYYLEKTNELVILSTDGYIRTYFCPSDGIEYYERQ